MHRLRTIGIAAALLFAVVPFAQAQLQRRNEIVRAIERARPAIVYIRTLRTIPARFESERGGRVRGLGTGVIIDPRGYVITNHHVVENPEEIEIQTSDGTRYGAKVIRFDARADLAMLRIEPKYQNQQGKPFYHLPLWGAGEPILGETIIAIGNPYGLEGSVTTGIVSAVDRELKLPHGETFSHLLQTDASINPGNSGGPLLNVNGDLLGVTVAIRSNAQGIAFAIPTAQVRDIVEKMMGAPPVSIASHGLQLEEIRLKNSDERNYRETPILRVSQVTPDSPADKIGFRDGDELTAIAGQRVGLAFDVSRVLWDRHFGDSIEFRVHRNGQEIPLVMQIAQPEPLGDATVVWKYLGVRVAKVSADRTRTIYEKLNGGLLLTEVAPDSPAARSGFRAGDILVGLHNWETIDANNIRYVMQWPDLEKHQPVEFVMIRDGKLLKGRIAMPALR